MGNNRTGYEYMKGKNNPAKRKEVREKIKKNHWSRKKGYINPAIGRKRNIDLRGKNNPNYGNKLKRIIIKCLNCKKEIKIKENKIKEKELNIRKFCSRSCSNIGKFNCMFNSHRVGKLNPMFQKENKWGRHTIENKRKFRLNKKRRMEIQFNNGLPMQPMIGKNEKRILDELELSLKYKIIRQYPIIGFWLDGYISDLNLAIEVDEKFHFNIDGNLKKRDIQRQKEIENELGCKFLRINEQKMEVF